VSLGTRRLGATGAEVSELALGTLTFGRETDEGASARILYTYLDGGGNLIDTADAYGRSEEVLGPLLKGIRDDVVIASKVGLPTHSGPNTQGTSRLRVNRQIERTLRRLDTDWVDVYYCHAWDPVTPLDETLSALHNLVTSGKVRYLGVSNYFGWQVAMARGIAALHDWTAPSLVTAEYSLVERGVEREIRSLCVHQNLALMPWSPLGGGLLSGKYRGASEPAADTRAGSVSNSSATLRRRMVGGRADAIANTVCEVADRIGRTPAQVALNWTMHRPAVVAPVVGVRTLEQLQNNLGASGWQLEGPDVERLDRVSAIDPGYPAEWDQRFGIRAGSRPDREIERTN
jgi:aryl-alcohol dehydrogenase-like predicted oxidoreductase